MEPDGGLQHPMQCEWRAAEEMVCCLCSMQADHEEDGSRQREAATEPSLREADRPDLADVMRRLRDRLSGWTLLGLTVPAPDPAYRSVVQGRHRQADHTT
jgi:hypothetical protein